MDRGRQAVLVRNVSNAWNGTFGIGVERADGPAFTSTFIKQPYPMVASDSNYPDLMGPGIGAQPLLGSHGEWVIAYHVDATPGTNGIVSRPLCFQRIYPGPNGPYVMRGHPWPLPDP